MSNIVIGKHTLESLTSGMYSDPYVIFREYIQNATDSIDEAIKEGILNYQNARIDIDLFRIEGSIVICDNGIGVPASGAESILMSIGNSTKNASKSRGFRGIGRLSGLSYCAKLVFETSAINEPCKTRITINAYKLSELLSKENKDYTAYDVLKMVYTKENLEDDIANHYFKVEMIGVDIFSKLLDYKEVASYVSQNAPVPYDPHQFLWGKEISRRILLKGYKIPSYNIYLSYGNETMQVYKPYNDEILVDKGKNLIDRIKDVNVFTISDKVDSSCTAVGWIAKTNYFGSISDKMIKGIRLRKGNILIGDYQTLNTIFKDARFNGWSIGEIFVVGNKLIPNTRRDNFENNQTYSLLLEYMTNTASGIVKEIRAASLKRNSELSVAIDFSKKVNLDAEMAINSGVNGYSKSIIRQKLIKARGIVLDSRINDETGAYYQGIAFEELDLLIGKLQGSTSFKAINALKNLNSTEKKTLEKVFLAIVKHMGDKADEIIDSIIDEFVETGIGEDATKKMNS